MIYLLSISVVLQALTLATLLIVARRIPPLPRRTVHQSGSFDVLKSMQDFVRSASAASVRLQAIKAKRGTSGSAAMRADANAP
jgi:hypothetical protein